ncbi:rhomboid family intramembrane serine protease [Sessilibacter sp. MAH2]
MSAWFPAAGFPLSKNLSHLDRHLTQVGITHRFIEEQSQNLQVLWLFNEGDVPKVKTIIDELVSGAASWPNTVPSAKSTTTSSGVQQLSRIEHSIAKAFTAAPLTLSLVVLGILGCLLVLFPSHFSVRILNTISFHQVFIPESQIASVYQDIAAGQFWRLFTPVFIHFSGLHIALNATMLWFLGSRIERAIGLRSYLILVVFTGIISNIVQAQWDGIAFFGGLSGVVFALVGYVLVWQYRSSQTAIAIPKPLIGMMIFSLILGFTPVLNIISGSNIANGAHLGGFIAGVIAAGIHRGIRYYLK